METTSITNILDGKLVSNQILNDVKDKIEGHIEVSESRLGYQIAKPSMAIVLVGNNAASESYVKGKLKACEKAGINHTLIRFDENITANYCQHFLFHIKIRTYCLVCL
jgi:methylenetetrahydrofolate dehydrogenase (NADP+)/methenyltetrahydrofolate cyclohydrolase